MWMIAIQEEIETLHKNKIWDHVPLPQESKVIGNIWVYKIKCDGNDLVPLPQESKVIGNIWVYKIKCDGNDQVECYHVRFVVKGYAWKKRIYFNEIFFMVVQLTRIKVVLVMCVIFDLHLEQLDVKIVFFS
jgi:hypothetical protein